MHLDATYAFFNGTSVFLRHRPGRRALPCRHSATRRPVIRQLAVATARNRRAAKPKRHGFGVYRAACYDELIDHPVEMGATPANFVACGVTS